MVEHRLAKARVAGSSPVSRSRQPDAPAEGVKGPRFQPEARRTQRRSAVPLLVQDSLVQDWLFGIGWSGLALQGRGTQVVRERSAKPLCVGSIPTRASKF